MKELVVTSPQFENNGWIPNCCAGYGEDKSPELKICGLPEETVSLVVVFDDLDHPISPGFNHWVGWNIDPVEIIPGGIPKGPKIDKPIHIEQGVAYGKHCYRGPKPPFNWNHRYRFTVYAIDTTVQLDAKSGREELYNAIESHIVAKGELIGKYQRKHKE